MRNLIRLGSGLVGVATIGCVAHAGILSAGGYASSGAPLLIALAAGLAMGALAIGVAWHDERYMMVGLIGAALFAGEGYALLLTSERTLDQREAKQAPLRLAADAFAKASKRVEHAQHALTNAPDTSPRLTAAIIAKSVADTAVVEKSAERACLANCRQLLQAQVDAAAGEVVAARAEITSAKSVLDDELDAARTAVAGMKPPVSDTPLADRLGLPGWKIDLLAAALASLAANGLGAFLLAFAAHGNKRAEPEARAPEPRDATAEADQFACASFRPDPEGRVSLADLRRRYPEWCGERGLLPLAESEFAPALGKLFQSVGLCSEGRGVGTVVKGIRWNDLTTTSAEIILSPAKPASRRLLRLGHMTAHPTIS